MIHDQYTSKILRLPTEGVQPDKVSMLMIYFYPTNIAARDYERETTC